MKKDAYYFSHFCNARHDRKIKRLRKELGIEGYGIYFMILEVLRDQIDFKYPITDLDLLADEFGTSEAKIKAVITTYDLFQFDETNLFSMKFIYYLTPYIEKSERARFAANKRWTEVNTNANAYANALPQHSKCNANKNARRGEESKVKESKGKESKIFIPPTISELKEYFKQNGYLEQAAEKMFNYYDVANWHDANGNKIRNWKQKAQAVWFKDENKATVTQNGIPIPTAKMVY